MATQIPNTTISLTAIDGTDCLGNSRAVINTNITTIGQSISSLTLKTVALSTSITSLNALLTANTTRLNTLSSTVSGINTSFNTNNIGLSTTLTTYVSSLSVFRPNGTYIGFIPIYI